jgi:zinc/manganese transport system substrate-binding protein
MKFFLLLFTFSFLPYSLHAKLNIVTTTTTLKSIVEEITKGKAKVVSLTKGTQDTHYVEAKPSLMIKTRKADLVVSVGLDLEIGWLPNVLKGSRNPDIMKGAKGYLETGLHINPIEIPKGKFDRIHGDVHPFGNPHYYLNPDNVIKVVDVIVEKLYEIDQKNGSYYEKNAENYKKILKAKTSEWVNRVKKSNIKQVITYHKNINYFLDKFGVKLAGNIEVKPGIPPTARHIIKTISKIKSRKIPCVFVANFYKTDAVKRIKKDVKIYSEVLPVDVVESSNNAKDYISLIDNVVSAFERCAGK